MTDKINEHYEFNKCLELFQAASAKLNFFFAQAEDYEGYEHNITEGFEVVQKVLFERLVSYPCAIQPIEYGRDVQKCIEVKPHSFPINLVVGRKGVDGVFEYPEKSFIQPELVLLFIEFFDLRPPIENRFVKFEILTCAEHAELVGGRGYVNSSLVSFRRRHI